MADILGVLEHFSPTGSSPYDILYDRSTIVGGLGPPDGIIDLPNDILGIVLRYHVDCSTPPVPGPTPSASVGLAFSIGVDTDGDTTNDCDTKGGATTCTPLYSPFPPNLHLDSLPNGLPVRRTTPAVQPSTDGSGCGCCRRSLR